MDTAAGVDFRNFSGLQVQVGSLTADRLTINGNVSFTGTPVDLELFSESGAFSGASYTILSWTGSRSGFFTNVLLDGAPLTGDVGNGWTFTANSNEYKLAVNPNSVMLAVVPEPASLSLLAFAWAACLRRRRA